MENRPRVGKAQLTIEIRKPKLHLKNGFISEKAKNLASFAAPVSKGELNRFF